LKDGKTWYEKFGYQPEFKNQEAENHYLQTKEIILTYRVSDFVNWLIKDELTSDKKFLLRGLKGVRGNTLYRNFLCQLYEQNCSKYAHYMDTLIQVYEPVLEEFIKSLRGITSWTKYYH
jgi:hypothetical protein